MKYICTMAGKQFLSLLCLCLLVPHTLTSPVTDILRKKHTQLAVLVVIGLDEIVTGGSLMAGLTELMGVSAYGDTYNHPCTGYSMTHGRYSVGWCRDWCDSFQEATSSQSCGEYTCCIPNFE